MEDVQQQLEEERIRNYAEKQDLLERWRKGRHEIDKLEAGKEKAVRDLEDEKRRNCYQKQSLLRTLLDTKKKLEATEAKM
jgi:hypothetical protein